MYCRNCGSPMDDVAAFCVKCGAPKGAGDRFCPNCGAQTAPGQSVCLQCGIALAPQVPETERKSKLAAGLLGIFLGPIGVHNFYLGKTTIGVIQIVVTLVTCGIGGLWGFIEGILIIAGVINKDGNGVPLKD